MRLMAKGLLLAGVASLALCGPASEAQVYGRGGTYLPNATTDATNATNITSGTLPSGRLTGAYTGITGLGTVTSLTSSGAITGTTITAGTQLIGKGTATNDNASAGQIGEYICAQVTNGGSPTGCATNTSTAVSLTTGVAANITSLSLTAGDWTVCGSGRFIAAGTTTVAQVAGGINETTATLPSDGGGGTSFNLVATLATGSNTAIPFGCKRESFSSTTAVFLVALASFGTSTMTSTGFIWARRER